MDDTKYCPKCQLRKSLDSFSNKANSPDKKQGYCKPCYAADERERKVQRSKRETIVYPITKRCPSCKIQKPNAEFNKTKTTVNGLQWCCKLCSRADQKRLREKLSKRETITHPLTKFCSGCKTNKPSTEFNKTRTMPDGLQGWCRDCTKAISKKQKHKNNKRRIDRIHSDPDFKLGVRMAGRIQIAVKRSYGKKAAKTIKLLGCTGIECMNYLEKLFWPGMTRENMGYYGWHIDHIRPIASFDKSDPLWQFKAFHYTNLQPLWKNDNKTKLDRLDWTPAESKHTLPERLAHFATKDRNQPDAQPPLLSEEAPLLSPPQSPQAKNETYHPQRKLPQLEFHSQPESL